jgi:hypothetical protein
MGYGPLVVIAGLSRLEGQDFGPSDSGICMRPRHDFSVERMAAGDAPLPIRALGVRRIAHLFVSCGHEDKDYEFSFCTSYEFIAHWLCIVAAFRRRRAGVRT